MPRFSLKTVDAINCTVSDVLKKTIPLDTAAFCTQDFSIYLSSLERKTVNCAMCQEYFQKIKNYTTLKKVGLAIGVTLAVACLVAFAAGSVFMSYMFITTPKLISANYDEFFVFLLCLGITAIPPAAFNIFILISALLGYESKKSQKKLEDIMDMFVEFFKDKDKIKKIKENIEEKLKLNKQLVVQLASYRTDHPKIILNYQQNTILKYQQALNELKQGIAFYSKHFSEEKMEV